MKPPQGLIRAFSSIRTDLFLVFLGVVYNSTTPYKPESIIHIIQITYESWICDVWDGGQETSKLLNATN